MSDLPIDKLISKLQEATEGSRELDAEVWAATEPLASIVNFGLADGWTVAFEAHSDGKVTAWPLDPSGKRHSMSLVTRPAPAFTTSIDAALTLVPEGYSWGLRKSGFGGPASVEIYDPMRSPTAFDPGNSWKAEHGKGSAALALCIASLRAISQTSDRKDAR